MRREKKENTFCTAFVPSSHLSFMLIFFFFVLIVSFTFLFRFLVILTYQSLYTLDVPLFSHVAALQSTAIIRAREIYGAITDKRKKKSGERGFCRVPDVARCDCVDRRVTECRCVRTQGESLVGVSP